MSRIRQSLATAGASLLLALVVSASQAQGPGGAAPGGGGPGGFGGPGLGGPGGRGGFGGNRGIIGLLNYPAVQEEIGLTADQKKKIETVKEAVAKKRQALMPRRNNPNAVPAVATAAGAQNGGTSTPAVGGQNGGGRGNRQRNNNNAVATDADGNPVTGDPVSGVGGPGGFGGGRFQPTPEMQAAFEEMRAFSESANANITSKILTKKQVARLTQIDLQRQGPMAVLNDDIALKLNISEDVLAEMKGIQDQNRLARRELFQAQRQNGPSFQTPDGRFDRAAMQAYRESPEGKAAQATMQKTTEQMQKDTIAQIGKLLSKNQKAKFKAMQGKVFDLSKLTANPTPPAATETASVKADATNKATSTPANNPPKTTSKKKASTKRATTSSNP